MIMLALLYLVFKNANPWLLISIPIFFLGYIIYFVAYLHFYVFNTREKTIESVYLQFFEFVKGYMVVSRALKDCFHSNARVESELSPIHTKNSERKYNYEGSNDQNNLSVDILRTMVYSSSPFHPKYQVYNKKVKQHLKDYKLLNNFCGAYKTEYNVFAEEIEQEHNNFYKLI